MKYKFMLFQSNCCLHTHTYTHIHTHLHTHTYTHTTHTHTHINTHHTYTHTHTHTHFHSGLCEQLHVLLSLQEMPSYLYVWTWHVISVLVQQSNTYLRKVPSKNDHRRRERSYMWKRYRCWTYVRMFVCSYRIVRAASACCPAKVFVARNVYR